MSTSMAELKKGAAAGNLNQMVATNAQVVSLPVTETAASATAAKVKALVQARYEMAIYRPRDLDAVRERMLKECRRPSFAEVARYSRPQGSKQIDGKWVKNYIEGPGIRFAEMAIRCMSNIVVETMTIYDDRERRIVNVSVTDLEGNVPYAQDITIQKAIERRSVKDDDVVLKQRTNSEGKTVYLIEATDDDIMNKQNALISKAIRTLGLRLVPGDIIDECEKEIIATQKNRDAQDPDAAKRRVFDAFSQVGITVENIKEYLGHSGESLTPKELQMLRGIHSAIKDGETTWRDVMEGKGDDKKHSKSTVTTQTQPAAGKKSEQPKTPHAQTETAAPKATVSQRAADAPATTAVTNTTDAGEDISDLYIAACDSINEAMSEADLLARVEDFAAKFDGHPKEQALIKKKIEAKRAKFSTDDIE